MDWVGFWHRAGNDQTNSDRNDNRKIRIKTFADKLCQLKNNVQDDGGIGGLAILHRRLEVNLFSGLDRIVVEAVTQAAHDAFHVKAAGSLEHYFQKNFAFNPQTPSLLSIDRSWLEKDFRRHHPGGSFRRVSVHGGRSGNVGAGKAAGLNRGAGGAGAGVRDGRAVAKSRAYDHAGHASSAAGAVARARSGGQIEGPECCDIDSLALVSLGGNSVGVAEATRLHLRRSPRDGGSG